MAGHGDPEAVVHAGIMSVTKTASLLSRQLLRHRGCQDRGIHIYAMMMLLPRPCVAAYQNVDSSDLKARMNPCNDCKGMMDH